MDVNNCLAIKQHLVSSRMTFCSAKSIWTTYLKSAAPNVFLTCLSGRHQEGQRPYLCFHGNFRKWNRPSTFAVCRCSHWMVWNALAVFVVKFDEWWRTKIQNFFFFFLMKQILISLSVNNGLFFPLGVLGKNIHRLLLQQLFHLKWTGHVTYTSCLWKKMFFKTL